MEITYNNQTLTFPDFLIAGASRSGTSSLYFYLNEHPEIFMPELKEPHFFNFIGKSSPHPDLPPWTVENYAKLFNPAGREQIVGEASAQYLYFFEESIQNIKKYYGDNYRDLKIIVMLRNPVERAWSFYNLVRRSNAHNEDFIEMLEKYKNPDHEKSFNDYILSGMYTNQLKAFLSVFPNLKVFLFEELSNNAARLIKDIFNFLDLKDVNFLPTNISTVYNFSGEPKNKAVAPIYKLLFRRSVIKNILKPILPYSLRQQIKTEIGRKIVKRKQMPKEVKDYLLDQFKPDLLSLLALIQNPRQKKIIESWLPA